MKNKKTKVGSTKLKKSKPKKIIEKCLRLGDIELRDSEMNLSEMAGLLTAMLQDKTIRTYLEQLKIIKHNNGQSYFG